jgi:hypothetical protein
MATEADRVAEIRANMATIREVTEAVRTGRFGGQSLHAATTALVRELAAIAVSDDDQATRRARTTAAADRFDASTTARTS